MRIASAYTIQALDAMDLCAVLLVGIEARSDLHLSMRP